MKTMYLLIVLSFLVCGCFTSTLVTPSGEGGGMSYSSFNEKLGSDEASLDFRDGQSVSGEDIHVRNDSVFWIDPETHLQGSLPVAKLRRVGRVNHTISALAGLGIGGAAGVAVAISGTSGPQHDGSTTGFYWVIAPPAGALMGAGVGALIGSPSGYEFKNEAAAPMPGDNK